MVKFNQLITNILLICILIIGCTPKQDHKKNTTNIIKSFKVSNNKHRKETILKNIPTLLLPPAYKKPELIPDDVTISFSATSAPLIKLLFIITKKGGLNLIIDKDVNMDQNITINLVEAPLLDAIKLAVDTAGYYYQIQGNILRIKKLMTKTFEIPFINIKPQTSYEIGGDMLGSTGENELDIKGEFIIKNETESKNLDYYKQLDLSIKNILSPDGKYTINKYTGSLIVTDHKDNLQTIENIINNLKKFFGKQVLIDAKIMEIVLNKEHQLGVNWQKTWNDLNNGTLVMGQSLNVASALSSVTLANPISSSFASSIKYSSSTFESIIQAMQSAGKIEVISNPRLKVLNGQSGIILSGEKVPYWEKKVEYTQETDPNNITKSILTPTITYKRNDVLNGISLGVMPIIKNNGDVILNIVPIIADIQSEKIFTDDGNIVATAPIIEVKEVATTILTKDGDMVVIGGLISSRNSKLEVNTPGLSNIPLVGNLFKRMEKEEEKRER